MAKRRVSAYSDEQRAQALAVLSACGGNVSEAARQTGLPRRTLSYWSNKVSDPETREQARRVAREVVNVARLARRVAMEEVARASLDDRFEDLAHRCIDGTRDPRKVKKASLRDLVWSAATSVGKMRLLREQPPPPTEPEQRMADAVAQAAEAIVQMAAQAGRTISLDDARKQICAIQLKRSELTLVQTD